MKTWARGHQLALVVALCAMSCASTETGNPPVQPDTGLEAGNVTFMVVPNMGDPGLLSGFVQMNVPFGAELHVTAVDTTLDTVRVPIVGEPLGFTTTLPAGFSGWLRLQIVSADGPPFGPLDVLTSDAAIGGMVELLPSPVGECLEVPTSLTLDADGAADRRARQSLRRAADLRGATARVWAESAPPRPRGSRWPATGAAPSPSREQVRVPHGRRGGAGAAGGVGRAPRRDHSRVNTPPPPRAPWRRSSLPLGLRPC
jgi:hypothetical protein